MKKATLIASLLIAFSLFSLVVYAFGSAPRIALYVTDTNQKFDVTVDGHRVHASYGETKNPDVIVKMDTQTFVDIFNSTDYKAEAYHQYNLGNVKVQVVADYPTLALKGYKAIFDSFADSVKKG